jgi:hypothetical protein
MAQVSQRRTVHGLDTVFRGGLLRTQVVRKGLLSTQVNYGGCTGLMSVTGRLPNSQVC